MSGSSRTLDVDRIRTRSLLIQKDNNSFPQIDGVLSVVNKKGLVEPLCDVNMNSIQVTDSSSIDSSGNINANSIMFDICSNVALKMTGDLYVNNANIYNSGDQYYTGTLQTNKLILIDVSANNQNTVLEAIGGDFLWDRGDSSPPLNITKSLDKLSIDPTFKTIYYPIKNNADVNLVNVVNQLIDILHSRKIFLAKA